MSSCCHCCSSIHNASSTASLSSWSSSTGWMMRRLRRTWHSHVDLTFNGSILFGLKRQHPRLEGFCIPTILWMGTMKTSPFGKIRFPLGETFWRCPHNIWLSGVRWRKIAFALGFPFAFTLSKRGGGFGLPTLRASLPSSIAFRSCHCLTSLL